MSKETGGPAFPAPAGVAHITEKGMTLRQYAAIKLKVPNSGTDCLDEMITQSLRNDFAAKAMQIGGAANQPPAYDNETRAKQAYELADAMLKAREQ